MCGQAGGGSYAPERGHSGRREAMRIGGAVGVMIPCFIDEWDEGWYHEDRILMYDSRKQAAEKRQYTITDLGNNQYDVRRPGGVAHRVTICRRFGIPFAGCDCYDFSTYGSGFNRACQHIWVVMLRFALEAC